MTQTDSPVPAPAGDKVAQPRSMTIIGWVLTVLPALLIIMGAFMSISQAQFVMDDMKKRGFPEEAPFWIGVAGLASALLYLFPRTTVLGAVLLTGYLGGAVVVHVHAREPFFVAIIVGVIVWFGIWFREPRFRALAPWRCGWCR